MKLHREGFPTLFYASVIYLFLNVGIWRLFHETQEVANLFFYFSSALLFFIFFFFRVRLASPKIKEEVIYSPAYGKVVNIEQVRENQYYKDERIIVSIFLSPLDIHCQYSPISGEVKYSAYNPGKYLVAYHPKSSELNEHSTTVIENNNISILVKQIAGYVARRIVPYLEKGMQVEQHQELGFIKFGSRVDLFFPLGTEIDVQVGDKVSAGKTVLAKT